MHFCPLKCVCVFVCTEYEMHHCSNSACVEDQHHHLREIQFIDLKIDHE